jgi:hypothetical protein
MIFSWPMRGASLRERKSARFAPINGRDTSNSEKNSRTALSIVRRVNTIFAIYVHLKTRRHWQKIAEANEIVWPARS